MSGADVRRTNRVLPVLLAPMLALGACGGSSSDFSGFESAEECLRAMPLVRPDIQADALADRCAVSIGMAEIALDAIVAEGSETESESMAGTGDASGSSTSVAATGSEQSSDDGAATTSSTKAPNTTAPEASVVETTTTTVAQVVDGIEVPDVQGLDHQLAQDTMQFAGLRNLAEEDASGAGRRLIWDRNWIVVDQDPAPGTVVDKDTKITLYSLKDDEVDG